MYNKGRLLRAGMVAALGLVMTFVTGGVRVAQAQRDSGHDAQIQSDVHKVLDSSRYSGVTASVHDGNVTLRGTVDIYSAKDDLDRKIHHVRDVRGVDNEVQVAGSTTSDAELRDKLAKKLEYDRVGYGTTAFNDITLAVHDGVVSLGGTVYGPSDKDSAMSLVENTRGVRDVIDNLKVAPLSPMDDQLRIALARAIYGAPQLQKYALDPARPIRITVVNGNVTLNGVVDSAMDRDVAGIRAHGVAGVFKITNNIQVRGAEHEK